jgi:hypothetical protein
MKYSFSVFQPPRKATLQLSQQFLLPHVLVDGVPQALGARLRRKVRPLFRTRCTRSIISMEKLSALRDGRERPMPLPSQ